MIDLSELKTISDVTIKLSNPFPMIDVVFSMAVSSKMAELECALGSSGITSCNGVDKNSLTIFPENYCATQLAERIATELEGECLVVLRLIPDPRSKDKSPSKEIQSFILA